MKKILSQVILQAFFLMIVSSIAHAEYTLQLATHLYKSTAEKYVKILKEQNYDAFIHTQERQISTGGLWYKVRMAPFPTMKAALDQKAAMLTEGFEGDGLC
jgi:septal ring-binding cell division protein DamX